MIKIGSEGGIIAIKNIDPYDFLGTKPPLGTIDEDGQPTSELSSATCDAGTYKKSQAVEGAFELVFGKVGFSETTDEESADQNDITVGRDKTKGYQNVSGNLDFQMVHNDHRFLGAVKGRWDFTKRGYEWNPYFREYEIWFAMNPDKPNMDMTECERLVKFIGVKLQSNDMEFGQPNSFKIPIFVREIQEFVKWKKSEWTAQDLFTVAKSLTAKAYYSLDNEIQAMLHTRLKFTFTGVSTRGPLRVVGMNLYGERVVEDVNLTGTTGTYLTKQYFKSVDSSGIYLGSGWAGTTPTFQVSEYDIALK